MQLERCSCASNASKLSEEELAAQRALLYRVKTEIDLRGLNLYCIGENASLACISTLPTLESIANFLVLEQMQQEQTMRTTSKHDGDEPSTEDDQDLNTQLVDSTTSAIIRHMANAPPETSSLGSSAEERVLRGWVLKFKDEQQPEPGNIPVQAVFVGVWTRIQANIENAILYPLSARQSGSTGPRARIAARLRARGKLIVDFEKKTGLKYVAEPTFAITPSASDVERIEAIKDAAIRFPALAETPVQARIRKSLQERGKLYREVWEQMRLLVAAQEADTASYFRQKLAKNH